MNGPSRSKATRSRAPARAGAETNSLQLTILGAERHADLPVRATLRRWIRLALRRDARLVLVFVDTREGRRLNRSYRGRDYATNVLTFDYQSRPEAVADIVLCMPVVRREARERGRTLRQHLAHLVVHGVLHAQGDDHETPSQARHMERREREILARLRIPDPYEGEVR
ncbi:endoribonuclease YbeY [Burkholderiales bacterium GJ-E10]|nr:endoribonuclease YbeY [Burkholderiales bacterium GJ-E10]